MKTFPMFLKTTGGAEPAAHKTRLLAGLWARRHELLAAEKEVRR